jgi:hypothetical protein
VFGSFGAQRLTQGDVLKIVNRYIGVEGGYLGDFSYRTHAEFYPEYCGLDIDPSTHDGTTRERFIQILLNANATDQSKILRGIAERFQIGSGPASRTQAAKDELLRLAARLEATVVQFDRPAIDSVVVLRALDDAETLLQTSGPISAVDRMHTAVHGYLRTACDQAVIQYSADASTVALWKLLRERHPQFQTLGPRGQDVERVLNACASILDAMNPIRNRASVAHANAELLDRDEALLMVNVARALVGYFGAKFDQRPAATDAPQIAAEV